MTEGSTSILKVVRNFFSAEECQTYITLGENLGFTQAPVHLLIGDRMMPQMRNNDRIEKTDTILAQQLWLRAQLVVPSQIDRWHAVGLHDSIRWYRYDVEQKFEWHIDKSICDVDGNRSRLTLLIYLNDDFEGGSTQFEESTIRPEQGMALFFNHFQRHKSTPILRGRKYVLRADVMYKIQ